MSRGQSTQAFNTSQSQNATDFGNAQKAFGSTESSIGDYSNQLAKLVSGNPYTAGGEYDQTINKGLANTSDAGSNSLKGALQSQSLRTGQNSAADAATAAAGAQANTRDLSTALATAQQGRIGSEASYNQQALGATATPITANQNLYGTSSGASNTAEENAANAAKTPSFWDEVGGGLAGNLGDLTYGGGATGGVGVGKGCWIAAELYGGWDDDRVHLLRAWIFGPLSKTFWGDILAGIYSRHGRAVAAFIRRNRVARKIAQAIFDRALVSARGWADAGR